MAAGRFNTCVYLGGFDHSLGEHVDVLGVSIFAQRDRRVRAYDLVVVPDDSAKTTTTAIRIVEKNKKKNASATTRGYHNNNYH